jgi:hypothetical protein
MAKLTTSKLTVLLLSLFLVTNNFIFFPQSILSWDVFGYYIYLPLKFIYHDLGLHHPEVMEQIIAKYHNTATFYQAMPMPDGGMVLKYTSGLAILYAPFFFIAHWIAPFTGYPADGFSLPYQYGILIGGMVYSILGLIFIRKVLKTFFSEGVTALLLAILVLGTNYLLHVTMIGQNAMSHNYLFTLYALILWFTIKWHKNHKTGYLIMLAAVCGLAILSRPSEFVCLVIPALWGVGNSDNLKEKIHLIKAHRIQVLLFAVILLGIGSIQFIYWKIHAGSFFFNSYGGNPGEGFEFLHPFTKQVLFSFRKGWLIYTPVMIFAIIGFWQVWKRNRKIFLAMAVYFLLNLYVVSSWSTWWYAQSFSQRALIPSYAVMLIPMGYFLQWLKEQQKMMKTILYCIIGFFMLLNIFQTIQLMKGVLSDDKMTARYYFAIFGKMSATEEERKLLMVNRSFTAEEKFTNEEEYTGRLLERQTFDSTQTDTIIFKDGKGRFRLDSVNIYSPTIEKEYREVSRKDHFWVRVSALVYSPIEIADNPVSLVVQFDHNGYAYKYRALDLDKTDIPKNKWTKITFDYLTPEVRVDTDKLRIYFWNRGKNTLYVDDVEVKVYEKKGQEGWF